MELFQKIPFTFEGKEYEIRILFEERNINVVPFFNNHPANGFRYQIQIPKGVNIQGVLEQNAANDLVDKAKKDITEKRWEKVWKIIQENKQ